MNNNFLDKGILSYNTKQAGMAIAEHLVTLLVIVIILIAVLFFIPNSKESTKATDNVNHSSVALSPQANEQDAETNSMGSEKFRVALTDNTILLAVISALIGAIAWLYTQGMKALNLRAKIFILEYLSDNQPHKREDIRRELKLRRFGYVYLDALADLLLDGKIILHNNMYSISIINAEKTKSSAQNSEKQ